MTESLSMTQCDAGCRMNIRGTIEFSKSRDNNQRQPNWSCRNGRRRLLYLSGELWNNYKKSPHPMKEEGFGSLVDNWRQLNVLRAFLLIFVSRT